jgi:hypothetical protein
MADNAEAPDNINLERLAGLVEDEPIDSSIVRHLGPRTAWTWKAKTE